MSRRSDCCATAACARWRRSRRSGGCWPRPRYADSLGRGAPACYTVAPSFVATESVMRCRWFQVPLLGLFLALATAGAQETAKPDRATQEAAAVKRLLEAKFPGAA